MTTIIILSFLLAVLMNLPMLLREKHLRRLSEAKLTIVKTLTEMENLLRAGQIKQGEICHDVIYQIMLKSQYSNHDRVPWAFWKLPSAEFHKFRARLHTEMNQSSDLARILRTFVSADFRALRNKRPFASLCFIIWTFLFFGGIGMMLMGLVGFFKARHAVKNAWCSFKQLAAESYVAANSSPPRSGAFV